MKYKIEGTVEIDEDELERLFNEYMADRLSKGLAEVAEQVEAARKQVDFIQREVDLLKQTRRKLLQDGRGDTGGEHG